MHIRRFFVFLFFAAFFFPCSGESTQSSLIPKDVYVGDEAEIRFEFPFTGNLFGKNSKNGTMQTDTLTFSPSSVLSADSELAQIFFSEDYTVKKIQLKVGNSLYVLSVFFIPWKTGTVDISAFDAASVFDVSVRPLIIDVPPVHIQSIVEKTGEKKLRPVKGPLIIPGTTYLVFGFCAAVLLLIAALTVLLIRFTVIRGFMQAFFERIFSGRGFRSACRELLFLEKAGLNLSDVVFCTRLSRLIRVYLENRFAYPFTAKTTSELVASFSEFFAYNASERSSECMQNLYEVCARCDYIRFSVSAAEDKGIGKTVGKGADVFSSQERLICLAKVRSAFVYFEQPEEQKVREAV